MFIRSFVLWCSLIATTTACIAQEREWNFDQTDSDAYLVFGVPETDDVGISLWCTKLSGSISLFAPETDSKLKPDKSISAVLEVNGKRLRYKGKTSENKEAGTTSLEIALTPDDKLFTALVDADRITVTVGRSTKTYPLVDVNFDAFVQLCRKP